MLYAFIRFFDKRRSRLEHAALEFAIELQNRVPQGCSVFYVNSWEDRANPVIKQLNAYTLEAVHELYWIWMTTSMYRRFLASYIRLILRVLCFYECSDSAPFETWLTSPYVQSVLVSKDIAVPSCVKSLTADYKLVRSNVIT